MRSLSDVGIPNACAGAGEEGDGVGDGRNLVPDDEMRANCNLVPFLMQCLIN